MTGICGAEELGKLMPWGHAIPPLVRYVPSAGTQTERSLHRLRNLTRLAAQKRQKTWGWLRLHREGRRFEPVSAHQPHKECVSRRAMSVTDPLTWIEWVPLK